MFDTFAVLVGAGLLASVVAGRALVLGLESLPRPRRRTAQWLVVAGAGAAAIAADVLSEGPGGTGVSVLLLAVLPGTLAFLVWRTMLASALVSLLPVYYAIGAFTQGRTPYPLDIALDRAVPLQPAWMIVYGSHYVFVLLPLLVVRDERLLRRALQAYLTVLIVAYAGFLALPTAAPRPDGVPGATFAAWCLRLNYALDSPYNCFPSLHVAHAFVSALACHRVHRGVGAGAGVWAALIGVSTLYTKQHYAVDVIAGALAAYAAYVAFLRGHPREAVAEHDRRRAPRRALGVVAVYGIAVACLWVAYRTGTIVVR